jgi:Fic-DOC domain mobile mystery protein B
VNGEGSLDGQAPIDKDEAAALLLPFRTREALNRAEEETILRARLWAEGSRMVGKELLTDRVLKRIHLEMFRGIWEWAGEYRQTENNIGIPWVQIPVAMKQLCDDFKCRVDLGKEERDSLAVEFHHRLVRIHPFPNGIGVIELTGPT